jgi:hypothetical protein
MRSALDFVVVPHELVREDLPRRQEALVRARSQRIE